mmetsp:Transcript_51194/g.148672  ORF Transcript_51194/g.148672 Transcript_51194/m.148672 type:complete len:98 (-) Transcript_51194:98-391(-)
MPPVPDEHRLQAQSPMDPEGLHLEWNAFASARRHAFLQASVDAGFLMVETHGHLETFPFVTFQEPGVVGLGACHSQSQAYLEGQLQAAQTRSATTPK